MAVNSTLIQGDSVLKNKIPVISSPVVSIPGVFGNMRANVGINADLLSKHMLLIGGTGCGKTNVFNHLISQTKNRMTSNDVMLIFDTKGDYYKKFYRDKDVIIANSSNFARFSDKWNIYVEILVDGTSDEAIISNANEITHSLFKEAIEKSSQPFFPNAARDLLASIIVAQIRMGFGDADFCNKYWNNKALREYLDGLSISRVRQLLDPKVFPDLASVLSYLGEDDNPQALGVLAELQNVARQMFVGKFSDDGRFSVRKFVREKGARTLFIEYDLSIGESLTPMYRLLFDLALKEAMGRTASQGNVFFICDEFKLLPNLLHIEDGVNFGRSLGVKIIAGIQSIEQLYEIYGESKGRNIAAGFSSILAFRLNDTTSREYISNLFGKNIVLEQYKGANNLLIEDKREGRTVEDWTLNTLDVGEAVVSLAFQKPFLFKFDLFRG